MTAERLLGIFSARPRIVLALFCLLLWTPGIFSLPPLDRDESRFAQASKQMLETGDFIDIRFGEVPRYKKPAGIYWLQAASTAIAGMGDKSQIWTYRLPSLFGALIAVFLTFWCARGFLAQEVAFLAAAFLGASLLLTGEASIATTDAVLLAAILGAQAVMMRAYLAAKSGETLSRWVALAGWAAFAIAILVKGPVILAVTGLSALFLSVWDQDARWLKATRPLSGIVLVLLVVAPWVLAIGVKSHWQFFQQSLGQDFATKLQGGQESHGFPPGYFLLALTPSFWPAILFILPGFATAIHRHAEPAFRFLLMWTATWLAFELVPTKLPHYVLPIYPALAIMAASWAMAPRSDSLWARLAAWVAPVQFLLMGLALAYAFAIFLPARFSPEPFFWVFGPALLLVGLTIGAVIAYFRGLTLWAALLALAAPVVLYPALTAGVGPHLSTLWVSPRAAELVQKLSHPGDAPPKLAGYLEPSLVFLLGTKTRQTDGHGAADGGVAEGGLALVEDREAAAFASRLAELEAQASEVGSLDGLNYSNGRKVHIRIWRVAPATETPPPPDE